MLHTEESLREKNPYVFHQHEDTLYVRSGHFLFFIKLKNGKTAGDVYRVDQHGDMTLVGNIIPILH